MTTILFAPRTIAAARRTRARLLAFQLRRLRRRLSAAVVDACRAIARTERQRREHLDMLHLDDRLLRDIGLSRSDVLAVARQERWTYAVWRLIAAAVTRLDAPAVRVSHGVDAPVAWRRGSLANRSSGRRVRETERRLAA